MNMAQKNCGNAIVAMVMVIVIFAIIASVVAPHFFGSAALQSRAFADQVQASLRNAQKIAMAQHQFVCVAFSASSIALTTGPTHACGMPLNHQAGGASHVVNAASGGVFSTLPSNFYFDASGKPSVDQMIGIAGMAEPITVKAGQEPPP